MLDNLYWWLYND